jgi:putative frv operon regulatory protein
MLGLARQTGVSSRTVCDIDYLNFTFSGKARITPSINMGYQLEIVDSACYFQLLQRHDNDDRLLAVYCSTRLRPAQLASTLNLPETWVAERLSRLKQRYERAFCVTSRPGVGHFVIPEEKRIILLANLLRRDPLLIPLPGITRENIEQLQRACENMHAFALVAGEYLVSVVLAIYSAQSTHRHLA